MTNTPSQLSSWQKQAVDRIVALTTVSQLEQALGKPFVKALRTWRRQIEGRDSHSTKNELVEALLVQHGADLLRNCMDLRKIIGKATDAGAPGAFHSGKAAAIKFVETANLPIELAGSPAPPRPPAAMVARGPQYLRSLEDYQQEAKERISDSLRDGSTDICSLPTGGGKTRVAIEAIVELLCREIHEHPQSNPWVMWVAHTRELCDQAVEAFRIVWEVRAAGSNLLMGVTADIGDQLEMPLREAMQEQWDAAVIVGTTGGQQRVAIMWDMEWVRLKDDVKELFGRGAVTTPGGKDVFPPLPLWSYLFCMSTISNKRGFDPVGWPSPQVAAR